ncbi:hypothetical protein AVEN_167505-1 [Araneus ventricosus]|uniref:Uncharacterized protein n=1 Tax=Araneus ventricosus TaxID=182803 RepID=A0A4Y2AVL3_ARAVE|nr:hypothetical protein AVEN_167505-1 [Araneus ventricosus]
MPIFKAYIIDGLVWLKGDWPSLGSRDFLEEGLSRYRRRLDIGGVACTNASTLPAQFLGPMLVSLLVNLHRHCPHFLWYHLVKSYHYKRIVDR